MIYHFDLALFRVECSTSILEKDSYLQNQQRLIMSPSLNFHFQKIGQRPNLPGKVDLIIGFKSKSGSLFGAVLFQNIPETYI